MRTEIELAGVSIADIWAAVVDFETYAETMEDVLEVRWDELGETRGRSTWRVLLNGSELTWTEDDILEPPRRLEFDQVDGDLEVFRGAWVLTEVDGGVRVLLTIEFDVGIPSLAPILDPIGIQAIRANARQMLEAVGREAPRTAQ